MGSLDPQHFASTAEGERASQQHFAYRPKRWPRLNERGMQSICFVPESYRLLGVAHRPRPLRMCLREKIV